MDPRGGAITSGLGISMGIRAHSHGLEIGSITIRTRITTGFGDSPMAAGICIARTDILNSIGTPGLIETGVERTGAMVGDQPGIE